MLFRSLTFGIMLYHNILHADLILVPILLMSGDTIKQKVKYIGCAAISFLGLLGADYMLTEQYVIFIA